MFAQPAPACRGAYMGRKRRAQPQQSLFAALMTKPIKYLKHTPQVRPKLLEQGALKTLIAHKALFF
jgi:hypothetical protein